MVLVPVTVTAGGVVVAGVASPTGGGAVVPGLFAPGLSGPNGPGGGSPLACSCSESCFWSASIFCSTSPRLWALGALLRYRL